MDTTVIVRIVEGHTNIMIIMIEVIIIVMKEGVEITIGEIEVKAEINIDLEIDMTSIHPHKI